MDNLFKRSVSFSDIHIGLKNNSTEHNDDCMDFLKWMISESKKRNCETCFFLGDFHHYRSTINVSTLNYMVDALELLNNNFEQIYFLVGNHDLFYREKRDIHSLPMGELFNNINMIDQPIIIKDVALVPWLMEDEWKSVVKMKSKYMFGHFEIPGFKMNALVEMPDHGSGLNKSKFKNQDYVFSGHFHKRQFDKNIHYIGNPFGHNFADTEDYDRGCMFLEWGGKPEYLNWEDGPKYLTKPISKIIDKPETHFKKNMYVKLETDIELSYEEVSYLKEYFTDEYNLRELKIVPKPHDEDNDFGSTVRFDTVDQIVINQIKDIESDTFDTNVLINIYNNLD